MMSLHFAILETNLNDANNSFDEAVVIFIVPGFTHRLKNGSGAHPASYPMGTRGYFPGGKAAWT
jgi:hypothetical protein